MQHRAPDELGGAAEMVTWSKVVSVWDPCHQGYDAGAAVRVSNAAVNLLLCEVSLLQDTCLCQHGYFELPTSVARVCKCALLAAADFAIGCIPTMAGVHCAAQCMLSRLTTLLPKPCTVLQGALALRCPVVYYILLLARPAH